MIAKFLHDTENLHYIFQKNEGVHNEGLSKNQEAAATQHITASQARDTQDTVNISEEARKLSEKLIAEAAEKTIQQQSSNTDKVGNNKLRPDRNDEANEPKEEEEPVKNGDNEGGLWCTVNTDNVDAEREQLEQNVKQIEQQLKNASDDEERHKELERQLLQAKSALSSKDNDTYRKANASYSYSEDRPSGA